MWDESRFFSLCGSKAARSFGPHRTCLDTCHTQELPSRRPSSPSSDLIHGYCCFLEVAQTLGEMRQFKTCWYFWTKNSPLYWPMARSCPSNWTLRSNIISMVAWDRKFLSQNDLSHPSRRALCQAWQQEQITHGGKKMIKIKSDFPVLKYYYD